MNKIEFLENQYVQRFIEWIKPKLDQEGSFIHNYTLQKNVKGQKWSCNSIYSAFENYKWNYTCTNPISQEKLTGYSFNHSKIVLDELGEGLREAIKNGDADMCTKYCISILEWGGVLSKNRLNIDKITASSTGIVDYLKKCTESLSFESD